MLSIDKITLATLRSFEEQTGTVKELARKTARSESWIRSSVRRLAAAGHVKVVKRSRYDKPAQPVPFCSEKGIKRFFYVVTANNSTEHVDEQPARNARKVHIPFSLAQKMRQAFDKGGMLIELQKDAEGIYVGILGEMIVGPSPSAILQALAEALRGEQ